MTSPVEVHQLGIRFGSAPAAWVVDGLDLVIRPGETLALLGESGSGKSMTSLGLMRLLPMRAQYARQGRILLEGRDLLDLPEIAMRQIRGKRIAMVFQEPMTALNPVLTVGQQLAEVLRLHENSADSMPMHERMVSLLSDVEMPDAAERLHYYPHQLSGGQKQRVVIAMALAGNPDILIADEPTTALDVTIQAQILALLKRLQGRYGMSMLLVTHDLGVVRAVADRVCVLYAGEIVEEATVSDFFEKLRHPYSRQLHACIPRPENRGQLLEAIPGTIPLPGAKPAGCAFHPRCAWAFDRCRAEVPMLQGEPGESRVRCHWYPEHTTLPPRERLPAVVEMPYTDTAAILSAEDMVVEFAGRRLKPWKPRTVVRAVDGLSFRLRRGETLALVGESGCGKTTATRAMLGLLPMQSGRVTFHGEDVGRMHGAELRAFRARVSVVFQDPFGSMNPRMTVAEILSEGLHATGRGRRDVRTRLDTLLDAVQMPKSSLYRYPHQFSGGQRQRLCIARALASEPEVLVCDEPTSALDVSVQAQILNLIKTLQRETGVACLFITHNMGVVSWMADTVIVMRQGKMVESGPCADLLQNPQAGYTRQLLEAVLPA